MAYSFFYLNWYGTTPLGLTPVLDGAENIALAEKIFTGTLPAEPFYRAMLYPLFLAIFRFAGTEPDMMMAAAGTAGMVFHLLTTLLIAHIAFILWKTETASLLAGALYGFYPLAVYFAAEPLDITAAIFCLSLGMYFYLRKFNEASLLSGLISGLAIGIGGLFRANVLALAGLFVVDLFIGDQRRRAVMALSAVILMTVASGLVGWWHSGEFRLMPWQGSFVLYAANSASANGKYFNQTIFLPDRDLSHNPARMESEILYARATGASGSYSIDDFNSFWRDKTLRHISENPGQWLGLQFRKFYYLLNNFEQYNNKTYAFHRDMSPALRYNPLCWGVLLIVAVLALINASAFSSELKRVLLALLLLASGTIVFLVSARFRFLLVPLLVMIAPGLLQLPLFDRRKLIKNLVVAVIVALVTFSSFFGAVDMSTVNSDRMLLAHACARLFDFNGQVYWADQVLREMPDHLFAVRVKLAGFTNLVLAGEKGSDGDWQLVEKELAWLTAHDMLFPDTAFLSGCYALKILGDREKAGEIWQKALNLYPEKDLYLAALVSAGFKELSASLDAPTGSLLWGMKIKAGLLPDDQPELFRQMQRAARFFFVSPESTDSQ
ncbi:MAG: hypothetical protein CVV42_05855 [Candidatus Riflebacteria bacterium HGW-Riflebacteria-2]|jgi:4-amino-4-deoxy-L-arabinose transferase-like glycosyltransferase|nr:MAG: hypothetical protein CVV42_05855 [Candidatus Riflebacteria bacterium HGW-Riflebacteria-2]